jgi:hypothetical protein
MRVRCCRSWWHGIGDTLLRIRLFFAVTRYACCAEKRLVIR